MDKVEEYIGCLKSKYASNNKNLTITKNLPDPVKHSGIGEEKTDVMKRANIEYDVTNILIFWNNIIYDATKLGSLGEMTQITLELAVNLG